MTPDQVKEARNLKGLTQEQFAELIGVSVFAVRKWEQGQRKPNGAAAKTIENMIKTMQ